jgi:hypothetical protein
MKSSDLAAASTTGSLRVGDVSVTWKITTSADSFKLDSAKGCVKGYCQATVDVCIPQESKAHEFCVFKGYADVASFTTLTVEGDASQCSPDGSTCNTVDACGIVLKSVVCRH